MSPYTVYIAPDALDEARDLPGHIRQRIKREIRQLDNNPRPGNSKALEVNISVELRRLRIDRWRVVYAISEDEKTVDILTIRKRPPYDYGDLGDLIAASGVPPITD